MKGFVPYLIAVLAVFAAGFFAGRSCRSVPTPGPVVRVDTLRTRDTLIEVRPVPVRTYVHDTVHVTMEQIMYETIHDTLYAYLPRETKHYVTSSYSATISGYRPELDSISVYPEKTTITVYTAASPVKAKRWGIGCFAGYGLTSEFKPAPMVGVGLSYNLIQF